MQYMAVEQMSCDPKKMEVSPAGDFFWGHPFFAKIPEPDYYKCYIYIWVNYNISLTWIKAIWGWFPLLTMIPSEVAVSSL